MIKCFNWINHRLADAIFYWRHSLCPSDMTWATMRSEMTSIIPSSLGITEKPNRFLINNYTCVFVHESVGNVEAWERWQLCGGPSQAGAQCGMTTDEFNEFKESNIRSLPGYESKTSKWVRAEEQTNQTKIQTLIIQITIIQKQANETQGTRWTVWNRAWGHGV